MFNLNGLFLDPNFVLRNYLQLMTFKINMYLHKYFPISYMYIVQCINTVNNVISNIVPNYLHDTIVLDTIVEWQ